MRFIDDISLVGGPLPWLLSTTAAAAGGRAAWRSVHRRWWLLPTALVVVVVALLVTAAVVHLPERLHGTYPPTFVLWAALPVTVAIGAGFAWRESRFLDRGIAAIAVVLLAAFAAARVNAFYGYFPTIGALRGAPVPGQVASVPQLRWVWSDRGHHRRIVLAGPSTQRDSRIGTVVPFTIPATTSHFAARQAMVWLPPVWFSTPHPALPAIEMLAGAPGTPDDWMYGGHAIDTLNAYAATHHGWGPIVVFADNNGSLTGDTECVDSKLGHAATYLAVDVVRAVSERFGVAAGPRHWGVVGLSEGGTCALVTALRNPATFGAFGDFSGDPAPTLGSPSVTMRVLFGGSRAVERTYDPADLLRTVRLNGMLAWFELGSHDRWVRLGGMRDLAAMARRDGARAVVATTKGGHTFYVWSKSLRDALPAIVGAITPSSGQAAIV